MSEERQTGREDRLAQGEGSAEIEPPPRILDTAEPVASREPPPTLEPAAAVGAVPSGRARLTHWWSTASPNLRGSAYMMAALLVYAVMVGAIKHVGGVIPLVQILLIRQIVMSLVLLAMSRGGLRPMLRTRRPGLQIVRSILTLTAMLCGFTAVIQIPLAQATAIGFSQVLFVTIAAVIVLKEVVDARRWARPSSALSACW